MVGSFLAALLILYLPYTARDPSFPLAATLRKVLGFTLLGLALLRILITAAAGHFRPGAVAPLICVLEWSAAFAFSVSVVWIHDTISGRNKSPIKPWGWILAALGLVCGIFVVVRTALQIGVALHHKADGTEVLIILIVIEILYGLVGAVLYGCLHVLSPPYRRYAPWTAFILMIPGVRMVWAFFIFPGVSKSLRDYFRLQAKESHGTCGYVVGLGFCVFAVATFLPGGSSTVVGLELLATLLFLGLALETFLRLALIVHRQGRRPIPTLPQIGISG